MQKNHEMDLTEGPILPKLIRYSLPLLATNILQTLFNVADVAVLGIMVGDDAVAAVGSTGALINLIVCLFVGLSAGANVVVARCVGERNEEKAKQTVGTSVFISLLFGVILTGIGVAFSRTFLEWMDCDADVIDMAVTYLRIYFLGMPIILLYNYASSILRAVGDTFRPLLYLIIAGVTNVALNVFFIGACHLDVEGVAIATVVSQLISAVLSTIAMLRSNGYSSLKLSYLRIYKRAFVPMFRIGFPAGLQSAVFSFSNVLVQSSVNSLGKVAMAGNSVGGNFDGIVYQAQYAVALGALAFVSQNLGAGNFDRIRQSVRVSFITVTVVGIVIGGGVYLLGYPLCSIVSDNPEVIEFAVRKLLFISVPYFLCGQMDTMSQSMRALGKSTTAMFTSLIGACLVRVVWLKTVFPIWQTGDCIFVIYPISWFLTTVIFLLMYFPTVKKAEEKTRLAKAKEEARISALQNTFSEQDESATVS